MFVVTHRIPFSVNKLTTYLHWTTGFISFCTTSAWTVLHLTMGGLEVSMIMIMIIAFKGTNRDWQSPHCAANRLQHVRSVATQRALITCKHVMLRAKWYEGTAQLWSLTELKLYLFELYFIGWIIKHDHFSTSATAVWASVRDQILRFSECGTFWSSLPKLFQILKVPPHPPPPPPPPHSLQQFKAVVIKANKQRKTISTLSKFIGDILRKGLCRTCFFTCEMTC